LASNFGNVFAMLIASAWLPFLPLRPIQILMQNVLYDISQISIPWDNVDPEFLRVPHRWSMKNLLIFMLFVGPWPSVFDVGTWLFMYYYYGVQTSEDNVALLQMTWFHVGLLQQTLIIHMVRSPKIPFIQIMASWPVTLATVVICAVGIALPYIPYVHDWLDFVGLDATIYGFVAAMVIGYLLLTQITKICYLALFKRWF